MAAPSSRIRKEEDWGGIRRRIKLFPIFGQEYSQSKVLPPYYREYLYWDRGDGGLGIKEKCGMYNVCGGKRSKGYVYF